MVGPLLLGGPLLPARQQLNEFVTSPEGKVLSKKIASDLSTLCERQNFAFPNVYVSSDPWKALAQTETAASATSATGRGKIRKIC